MIKEDEKTCTKNCAVGWRNWAINRSIL